MECFLVITKEGVIFGAGETEEQAKLDFIKNTNEYENIEFDFNGCIINEDGTGQSKSESVWRLIMADCEVKSISEIIAETTYTEI